MLLEPASPTAAAQSPALQLAHARIDCRLLHGQVLCGWLPHLELSAIVIADDEAASDPLRRCAMEIASPPGVALHVVPLAACRDALNTITDRTHALLIVATPDALLVAMGQGVTPDEATVGVCHAGGNRVAVTPSVFLDLDELKTLREIERRGVAVVIRSVPGEKGLTLREAATRVGERLSQPGI